VPRCARRFLKTRECARLSRLAANRTRLLVGAAACCTGTMVFGRAGAPLYRVGFIGKFDGPNP
jgi:hypothetical protein